VSLFAPAKVNLGLHITGRREDGYHLLDSLFVPLDFGDDVRVEAQPRDAEPSVALAAHVEANSGIADGAIPSGPENLAARAATAFLKATGTRAALSVELTKRVPAGGGLGGGSSDAAAVLRGLDQLFPAALAPSELAALALELGADVPFFLDPRPARVRGIGEQIEPLAGVPSFALVLANPGISLATSDVYGDWDTASGALTPHGPRPTMPPAFGPGFDVSALSGWLWNDLEAPAVRLCPPIARLQEQLTSLGALAVGMSGSGATAFGVFGSSEEAEAATSDRIFAAQPSKSKVWVRAVCTMSSPEAG
jgi:4-diphosphocytidyl-2-C-methyl-D-erythritol kinase